MEVVIILKVVTERKKCYIVIKSYNLPSCTINDLYIYTFSYCTPYKKNEYISLYQNQAKKTNSNDISIIYNKHIDAVNLLKMKSVPIKYYQLKVYFLLI